MFILQLPQVRRELLFPGVDATFALEELVHLGYVVCVPLIWCLDYLFIFGSYLLCSFLGFKTFEGAAIAVVFQELLDVGVDFVVVFDICAFCHILL